MGKLAGFGLHGGLCTETRTQVRCKGVCFKNKKGQVDTAGLLKMDDPIQR